MIFLITPNPQIFITINSVMVNCPLMPKWNWKLSRISLWFSN